MLRRLQNLLKNMQGLLTSSVEYEAKLAQSKHSNFQFQLLYVQKTKPTTLLKLNTQPVTANFTVFMMATV